MFFLSIVVIAGIQLLYQCKTTAMSQRSSIPTSIPFSKSFRMGGGGRGEGGARPNQTNETRFHQTRSSSIDPMKHAANTNNDDNKSTRNANNAAYPDLVPTNSSTLGQSWRSGGGETSTGSTKSSLTTTNVRTILKGGNASLFLSGHSQAHQAKHASFELNKEEKVYQTSGGGGDGHSGDYGAACLIIMDDNHFLTEFIAYHYLFLPLRRLIVGIDPKSKTSPLPILDRWKSRINITVWYDKDYFHPPHDLEHRLRRRPKKNTDEDIAFAFYLRRQRNLYHACMRQLKLEQLENDLKSYWTAIIDTDEYIVPNRFVRPKRLIRNWKPTVIEMLNDPGNRQISNGLSRPCVGMHRFNMGVMEETNSTLATRDIPPGFDYHDFNTLRWRYPVPLQVRTKTTASSSMSGKALIDLSRIPLEDIELEKVSAHRPLTTVCTANDRSIPNEYSTFVVHHYIGTFEQWSHRDDSRNKRTKEKYYQLLEASLSSSVLLEQSSTASNVSNASAMQAAVDDLGDDSTRFFLKEFVKRYGLDEAKRLLEGAGRIEGYPKSTTTTMF
jgi:hypothetical protein